MIFRSAIFLLLLISLVMGAEDVTFLKNESRRYSDQIEKVSTQEAKKAAAEKSLAFARRAVAANPNDGGAHVTLAVALGKMTDFSDNRTKMEYAKLIREEAEIGLKLDPKNDFACLILGKWHDEMSRLNPILKALATTIYGKMPEASSVSAEKYLRKAVMLDPSQMRHHAELAMFLERKGLPDEAAQEWQKVVALPPKDAEDRGFIQQAKKALGQ